METPDYSIHFTNMLRVAHNIPEPWQSELLDSINDLKEQIQEEINALPLMISPNEGWLAEAGRRLIMTYETWENFSRSNQIDIEAVDDFSNGNPVESEAFKSICEVLDFDWEQVSVAVYPKQR